MPGPSVQELAAAEIDRLTAAGFHWLRMPEPLEDGFEKATRVLRARRLWLEGLLAIGLFNVYVLVAYFIAGGGSWQAVQVRLYLVTPIALIVNFSMRWTPSRVYRESSIAVVSCFIGLMHLYLESGICAASSAYAQVGLIVAVIFVNVVMRLEFPYAAAASAIMLAGDLVFIQLDRFLTPSEKLLGVTLAVCAIAMTIVANYSIDRDERVGFLMRLRSEIQSRELTFLNIELQRLSSIDSLTGLANRHSYEQRFAELWKQTTKASECFSAIVIDIDHFKATNDAGGHLYGDRVLSRVASLLSQSLRCKDDFAARFGGEEFIVLLPNTDRHGAVIVAERIRKLVETAGSPALIDSGVPPRLSTVSCGVSSCWPSEALRPDDLVDAADKALYRAKAEGRNRVNYGDLAHTPKKYVPPQRDIERGLGRERPSGSHKIFVRVD